MGVRNEVSVLVGILVCCFLLFPVTASAIPSLGVAPGGPNDGVSDTYVGAYAPYLATYADTFLPGVDGFLLRASGGSLTVWYGTNNSNKPPDLTVPIYLATDALAAAGGGFSFHGTPFSLVQTTSGSSGDQADGYKPLPYYGVLLPAVGTAGGWAPFSGWQGTWWTYTANLAYNGLAIDDWMFAIADFNRNGVFDDGVDQFSPKTASSTGAPVPEPTTLLLLGSGLVGLRIYSRKVKKSA